MGGKEKERVKRGGDHTDLSPPALHPPTPHPLPPVASPDLRSLLRDPAARASAEAVLAAPNPAAALEAATARGGSLAPLSDAVLDAVAPDEKA